MEEWEPQKLTGPSADLENQTRLELEPEPEPDRDPMLLEDLEIQGLML